METPSSRERSTATAARQSGTRRHPAYRSRDRLEYLVGTEVGAGTFANDALPEEKAAELRAIEVTLDVA